jgi:hypothetical protein
LLRVLAAAAIFQLAASGDGLVELEWRGEARRGEKTIGVLKWVGEALLL